jgi:hypothetical protein
MRKFCHTLCSLERYVILAAVLIAVLSTSTEETKPLQHRVALAESTWVFGFTPAHAFTTTKHLGARRRRTRRMSFLTKMNYERIRDDSVSCHSSPTDDSIIPSVICRRDILKTGISFASTYSILIGDGKSTNAADHRQLELCLVSVLRVLYWSQCQIEQIDDSMVSVDTGEGAINRQRALYLETRLGAKAALTGRISGSGATRSVYTLTTLQLSGCLQDIEWYGARTDNFRRNYVDALCTSFREGLASIVEFDGLDTLTDPSPRSALTISQYNVNKLKLIRRILNERIIPNGQKLVIAFGPEAYQRSNGYIMQYYSSELPGSLTPTSI